MWQGREMHSCLPRLWSWGSWSSHHRDLSALHLELPAAPPPRPVLVLAIKVSTGGLTASAPLNFIPSSGVEQEAQVIAHSTDQPTAWSNRDLLSINKDEAYTHLLLLHIPLTHKHLLLDWILKGTTQYKMWWHKYTVLGNEISFMGLQSSQPHRGQWACSDTQHITNKITIWESHHTTTIYNQGMHAEYLPLKVHRTRPHTTWIIVTSSRGKNSIPVQMKVNSKIIIRDSSSIWEGTREKFLEVWENRVLYHLQKPTLILWQWILLKGNV